MTRPDRTARDDIIGRLRDSLNRPGPLFRGERDAPASTVAHAPVTQADGDARSLITRFGQQLTKVQGSYEIVPRREQVAAGDADEDELVGGEGDGRLVVAAAVRVVLEDERVRPGVDPEDLLDPWGQDGRDDEDGEGGQAEEATHGSRILRRVCRTARTSAAR